MLVLQWARRFRQAAAAARCHFRGVAATAGKAIFTVAKKRPQKQKLLMSEQIGKAVLAATETQLDGVRMALVDGRQSCSSIQQQSQPGRV